MIQTQPLLTIAIPTYNRAKYLDKCLSSVYSQLEGFDKSELQILVSDNASTDETFSIIKKYEHSLIPPFYIKNVENLGPDFNILQCFKRAKGKYVWIIGDDDFVLPNYLFDIINLLRNNNVGVVYMNGLWYQNDKDLTFTKEQIKYETFIDPLAYIERVNYWFTFISGNIVNKNSVIDDNILSNFRGTNLIQIGWVIPAVFNSSENIIISNSIIACKANNTGGYKLFKVFASNFDFILNTLIKNGIDRRIKRIIKSHLLESFFPSYLKNPNNGFEEEKYISVLFPVFWSYKRFWKSIFPLLIKRKFNS